MTATPVMNPMSEKSSRRRVGEGGAHRQDLDATVNTPQRRFEEALTGLPLHPRLSLERWRLH